MVLFIMLLAVQLKFHYIRQISTTRPMLQTPESFFEESSDLDVIFGGGVAALRFFGRFFGEVEVGVGIGDKLHEIIIATVRALSHLLYLCIVLHKPLVVQCVLYRYSLVFILYQQFYK